MYEEFIGKTCLVEANSKLYAGKVDYAEYANIDNYKEWIVVIGGCLVRSKNITGFIEISDPWPRIQRPVK